MMSTKNIFLLLATAIIITTILSGCDDILGTKQDDTTKEIFEAGRIDPRLVPDDVAYAALTPFWTGFNQPTDVFVGYDELVYVTDADGLHVLDRAGRRFKSISLRGAVAVTMDRRLNVYVAARKDTLIAAHNPTAVWDLAAIYKFRGLNQGDSILVDLLIHPFSDNSRPTTSSQRARLVKGASNSDELVEITGIGVLADNTLYVTRRGPVNPTGVPQAPDNTVLIYGEARGANGNVTGKMNNLGQIRAISPTTPSLLSGIGISLF
jgi:hypothetical protein